MKLLWFLLGLAAGLAILGCYRARLNSKLKLLLQQDLAVDSIKSSIPSVSRLATVIHQQRQLSRHLEQELVAHEQILHTAPIGYLQVDEETQLCWSNLQARQLLGIEKVKDQTSRRLLLELVRSYELDCLIEETRTAQQPCQKDWIFHSSLADPARLSRSHPLRGHAFPLPDGYVGVFLEDRQEAVTLTQERDRWASDVAHELKTPLTSIRLVAETLQSRLDPPLRTWVDRLLNETTRLGSLVQDLLELSRLTLKLPNELTLKTINLPGLIHSTWLNLEPLTSKKQLRLDYSGPDRLLIQADEPRLYRVLLNLLDNSIKYSPLHQSIKVQVSIVTVQHLQDQGNIQEVPESADAHMGLHISKSASQKLSHLQDMNYLRNSLPQQQAAYIEVIDAGPGFPEHALPYVFDRFYRVDPARSRKLADNSYNSSPHLPISPSPHPRQSPSASHVSRSALPVPADVSQMAQTGSSSGLGLAIVRQIVEAHGGLVRAGNHSDTGGAWLQVFLPLHPLEKG